MADIRAETTSTKTPVHESVAGSLNTLTHPGINNMSDGFEYKQGLIVRLDLKMGRGKIAVQCSHAAVNAAEKARLNFPRWWKHWMEEGQAKIALKVPDLDAILRLEIDAKAKGLPIYLVKDMGLTQVEPGTITCLGVGPAPSHVLDGLTGDLPLL